MSFEDKISKKIFILKKRATKEFSETERSGVLR